MARVPVTDPEVLAALEAGAGSQVRPRQAITDPKLIAELDKPGQASINGDEPGLIAGLVSHAGAGASLGLARHLAAGITTGIRSAQGDPRSAEDIYRSALETSAARDQRSEEAHPTLMGAADIGGSMLLGSGAASGIRALAPRLAGRAVGTVAGRIGAGTIGGIAQGAVRGAADTDANRLEGAVRGAEAGGIGGLAGSVLGEGFRGAGSWMRQKLLDRAAMRATAATGATAREIVDQVRLPPTGSRAPQAIAPTPQPYGTYAGLDAADLPPSSLSYDGSAPTVASPGRAAKPVAPMRAMERPPEPPAMAVAPTPQPYKAVRTSPNEMSKRLGREMLGENVLPVIGGPEGVAENAFQRTQDLGPQIGEIVRSPQLRQYDLKPRILARLRGAMVDARTNAVGQASQDQARAISNVIGRLDEHPSISPADAHAMRTKLSESLRFNKGDVTAAPRVAGERQARSAISEALNAVAENEHPGWSALERKYQIAATVQDLAEAAEKRASPGMWRNAEVMSRPLQARGLQFMGQSQMLPSPETSSQGGAALGMSLLYPKLKEGE